MKPRASYIDKCYGTGVVGYEGVKFLQNDHWEELVQAAKKFGGFVD